jgi:hypothetical protein
MPSLPLTKGRQWAAWGQDTFGFMEAFESHFEMISLNVLHYNTHVTQKIHQFSCKGRKPRNKKTKGTAEDQRNAQLCITESRKPGFLDYKSSVHAPSGHQADQIRLVADQAIKHTKKSSMIRLFRRPDHLANQAFLCQVI